jgi:hypothetical protein
MFSIRPIYFQKYAISPEKADSKGCLASLEHSVLTAFAPCERSERPHKSSFQTAAVRLLQQKQGVT